MRRLAAVLLMAVAGLLPQGCVVVVATAARAAALTVTTLKTTSALGSGARRVQVPVEFLPRSRTLRP